MDATGRTKTQALRFGAEATLIGLRNLRGRSRSAAVNRTLDLHRGEVLRYPTACEQLVEAYRSAIPGITTWARGACFAVVSGPLIHFTGGSARDSAVATALGLLLGIEAEALLRGLDVARADCATPRGEGPRAS